MEKPHEVDVVRPKWLAAGAVAVLLGLVLRAAWVTEDAYITLRSVDNWVNGFGLRWNVGERVQGYTHPLWMLVLAGLYALFDDAYGVAVTAGLGTTALALVALVRCARSSGHAVAAVVLLLCSRAFVEFSTSGLENPLTHLLIAIFVSLYVVREGSFRALTLAAALLALNRIDALIVALPALAHAALGSLRARGLRPTLRDALVALSPYLAWELFSLLYYGFLVPNTAFAKLNTGLPSDEVWRQGITYLLNAMAWDPPLLVVIGLGCAVAVAQRRTREQLLALGIGLYVVYVMRIGGDFMLGRFFTLPLFAAVCLLAVSRLPLEEPSRLATLLLPFAMLFVHTSATEKYPVGDVQHSGVADERSYYREGATLMMFTRRRSLPEHGWAYEGRMASVGTERVVARENIGFFGFFAGPTVHIVDTLALTDPLLARLPVRYDPAWRVGHYRRFVPPGYLDTLRSGRCMMTDTNLCAYYAKLQEVIAGDVWSLDRLGTVLAFNVGAYDYLIDRERYRHPELQRDRWRSLAAPLAEGAPVNAPGARMISVDGIEIELDRLHHEPFLAVMTEANDRYLIELRSGPSALAAVETSQLPGGGLYTHRVEVPEAAREEGYDRVLIRPIEGDGSYATGYLRLVP